MGSDDALGWAAGTPLRFVQLEVVALQVDDDSSLATIGVVVSSAGVRALELTTLTGAQLDTIRRPLREEFSRPLRLDPVVAVPDGQPVRFAVASGDLALELTPRLRWDEREVDLDLVADHAGERASARVRLADDGAALLRVPGRDGTRWALVTAKLFSLEEEDLRRFNVDRH